MSDDLILGRYKTYAELEIAYKEFKKNETKIIKINNKKKKLTKGK